MLTTSNQLVKEAINTCTDTQNISPRSGTDPAPATVADYLEKYEMCEMDLERYMVMCGMKPGQESLILKCIVILETKGLSK